MPKNTRAAPSVRVEGQTVSRARGEHPPYNDFGYTIHDIYNSKIYMLGGMRPNDDSNTPTNDFYCCDVSTMTWSNLTKKLTRRQPYDPFSDDEDIPRKQGLPRVSHAGCSLLRIRKSSFVAMCGGYDLESNCPSPSIIIIDLQKHSWWTLKLEGGLNVPARISPAVVAIGGKIYIFGGYSRFDDDDPQLLRTFSVAEYFAEKGVWKWAIEADPYPFLIPHDLFFLGACSVYKGTKILLTPGRSTHNDPIHFTNANLFFYHTTRNKFQYAAADFEDGDLPRNIACYELGTPYDTTHNASSVRSTSSRNGTSPAISSISQWSTSEDRFSDSSVFICAWIPVPDTDHLAPELWHLRLSPDEEIKCYNINKRAWDLDYEFKSCILPNSANGRLRILGTEPTSAEAEPRAAGRASQGARKRRRLRARDSSDDSDNSDEAGTGETFNIFFDIDLSD